MCAGRWRPRAESKSRAAWPGLHSCPPASPPPAQQAHQAPEPMSLRCAVEQGWAGRRPSATARSMASCAIRRYVVHLPPAGGSTVSWVDTRRWGQAQLGCMERCRRPPQPAAVRPWLSAT
jgi:hypothetical protein